jgi:hypothetical protein
LIAIIKGSFLNRLASNGLADFFALTGITTLLWSISLDICERTVRLLIPSGTEIISAGLLPSSGLIFSK